MKANYNKFTKPASTTAYLARLRIKDSMLYVSVDCPNGVAETPVQKTVMNGKTLYSTACLPYEDRNLEKSIIDSFKQEGINVDFTEKDVFITSNGTFIHLLGRNPLTIAEATGEIYENLETYTQSGIQIYKA